MPNIASRAWKFIHSFILAVLPAIFISLAITLIDTIRGEMSFFHIKKLIFHSYLQFLFISYAVVLAMEDTHLTTIAERISLWFEGTRLDFLIYF